MISNNHSYESPIKGSVRARILKFLWDEEENRFSEIKKEIGNADNIIKRELDILIQRGWIIQKDRGLPYVINKKEKRVNQYIHTLTAMPDPDAKCYPVDLDTSVFEMKFEEFKLEKKQTEDIFPIDEILSHITITVAGKKLEHFDPAILNEQFLEVYMIIKLMKKIALTRIIAEAEEAKHEITAEHIDDLFYNQDFSLLVSWSPEKK